ncbi:uncharacterized protein LOC143286193 [Babylonia areolata]|uniref:uncharacterized protein LOC143286193 n=1 Tax=Babylonia areolata TaxID=304850 RepID=UPI003FD2D168
MLQSTQLCAASSHYQHQHQQPLSRVSPVMESEEDYNYDTDDYSSIQTHANGEPYMVTDVYHQPIPLATPQGSDSGPEYSTPFAHNNGGSSPGSLRRVFSPPPPSSSSTAASSFLPGAKQKPRMGVMAARNLSDKNPSNARALAPDGDPENPSPLLPPVSDDDYDSPVYDSTQYIVTPTRRRNSENEKTVNGRTLNRREVGGGLEYPEIRGRLGEGEEMVGGVVPPGVVLLQPNVYQDGTLDSQMMSEIEMANLRATMRLSPDPETVSGDSTAHDRLLTTGNHVMNGHGAHYPAPNHHHPQKHYQNHHHHMDAEAQGSASSRGGGVGGSGGPTGSGAVFRRKRAPCWCVLLVLVAVALLAAGVSLGVLFGVMKAAEGPDPPHAVHRHDASTQPVHPSSSVPTGGGGGGGGRGGAGTVQGGSRPDNNNNNNNASKLWVDSPDWGGLPPPTSIRTPSNPSGSVVVGVGETGGRKESGGLGGLGGGGSGWGVSVRRFKAYWHPGDSRLMEVLLSNGTRVQASGLKRNDGTFHSLYSLTVTTGQERTTRVWFMGGRSLGSVLLPDGTAVNLDWSANDADIECKIFQIPPPRGAPGGGPGGGSPDVLASKPTSHLATLQLGVHSYLLRQITRTLAEAAEASDQQEEEDPTPRPKFCTPRLPVKVTKCGGQYPYDGAFVQGEIALQTGPALAMAALPWKWQDDEDECYRDLSAATPNFFIPLPVHIERGAARVMAERFWRTAAVWWRKVCGEVGAVLAQDLKRHEVCANMAASSRTQLSHSNLYNVVYDSCSAVLTSLHLACRTLHELTTRAAAATAKHGGGGAGGGGGGGGSRESLTHDLLHRVLANATSLQEPATIPEQDVQVRTHAFCPSTQPMMSHETSVTLKSSLAGGRGVSSPRDIRASDTVRVDCSGHPEVTYFYLGHAAAIQPLERVKHLLKVCAVCAFDTTLSVHVLRDHMCCNDTCSRESRCEDSISEARGGLGLRESHTVREHGNVYCHEFLTAADTPTRALDPRCMGTCQSNLEVRFQVREAQEDGSLPMEGSRMYFDQVLTCLEGFRGKCKSTFGH